MVIGRGMESDDMINKLHASGASDIRMSVDSDP
jgi:hypothetical protein